MQASKSAAVSLLALGALLVSLASHATDLAELPLKASVLAKPNVIFGMDDSGSMDAEIMLNTNDGAFWWDSDAKNGWNTSGVPWFNLPGTSSSQWRKYFYLFPNGTGTGARTLDDSTNDHFAVPPTAQFAWLRSSSYNPLYYNPAVTYAPWSPAYVSSALTTYSAASKTAARSHPISGTETVDLSAVKALTKSEDYTFMAVPGMVIPKDAQYANHASCCSWSTVTDNAGLTVATGKIYRVAMAYRPATYYRKESCTVATNGSCVAAPDGATLKRYEIVSGTTFPTGRSYADELQNFANWYTYYRKRKLMLAAAMGEVLEPLTGMRMGVVRFNSNATVTMYDSDATSAAVNGRKVAGLFYDNPSSGGTPARETLKYIGEQYRNTASTVQYACQRNNAFIVTDGFAYASSVAPPAYTKGLWGTGAPYETTYANSLADIALSYYTINLRGTLAAGRVPPTTTDLNTDLHMNTYGLTLGAKGTLFVDETTPAPTTASAWPNPNADRSPTAVDDLWHATINGRGRMYTAATPEETAIKIQSGLNDILSSVGAQGGVAVSTVNLSRGDGFAYLGRYNPAGWSGDLTANAIDASTAVISTRSTWSASEKLLARTTARVIATATAAGGTPFTASDAVGAAVNPGGAWGTTADVVAYLRGDRTNEGSDFRRRTSLMGAVLNAEPTIDRDNNVVYVASGEGMLHAIDIDIASRADVGKELWAFVPRAVLPDLGQTTARAYAFRTQLDGTPVVGKSGASSKLLVAGMGAAGRGYYAIDVSAPRSLTEDQLAAKYRWDFPGAGATSDTQAKVGQTVGKPAIVRTVDDGYVVVVTSGYNNGFDGKGRLWMLNAASGAVIHEFTVDAGTLAAEAGLAHVTPYAEDDGSVRYVFGGDLLGNLWRFDLKAKTAPFKVAVLKNGSNVAQPVTAAPELAYIGGQRVVIVGTGRILGSSDFGNTATQSMYAIAADGTTTLDPARNSLVRQTYTHTGDAISSNAVDWSSRRGWYMDLPAGEQANTRPALAYGAVAFTTNITGASDCSASSYFYVLDVANGGRTSSNDRTPPAVSTLISGTSNSSGVTAVQKKDGATAGLTQTYNGVPGVNRIVDRAAIQPSRNAWREVRR